MRWREEKGKGRTEGEDARERDIKEERKKGRKGKVETAKEGEMEGHGKNDWK